MSNTWFAFKQFTIHQERCAMKVGTDGVLLGAWTPLENVNSVLDVGTGTGLLALMLAQRSSDLTVDAIDIDRAAVEQASENAGQSPFSGRIQVLHANFNDFIPQKKYDLVISNPPYFKNSLTPAEKARSNARHMHSLSLEVLIERSISMLYPNGKISLILPADQFRDLKQLAATHGFSPEQVLEIHPVPGKPAIRTGVLLSRNHGKCITTRLVIEENGRHGYSAEYKELTNPFYLDK